MIVAMIVISMIVESDRTMIVGKYDRDLGNPESRHALRGVCDGKGAVGTCHKSDFGHATSLTLHKSDRCCHKSDFFENYFSLK